MIVVVVDRSCSSGCSCSCSRGRSGANVDDCQGAKTVSISSLLSRVPLSISLQPNPGQAVYLSAPEIARRCGATPGRLTDSTIESRGRGSGALLGTRWTGWTRKRDWSNVDKEAKKGGFFEDADAVCIRETARRKTATIPTTGGSATTSPAKELPLLLGLSLSPSAAYRLSPSVA